jgi:hypothetical protein
MTPSNQSDFYTNLFLVALICKNTYNYLARQLGEFGTEHRKEALMKFVIRFRDGSFFRNLKTVFGPIGRAKRFNFRKEAYQFMRRHPIIISSANAAVIRAADKSKA